MYPSDPPPYQLPDAGRLAAIDRVRSQYLVVEPLEPRAARRFVDEGVRNFVELGAGSGPISALLAADGVECIAVDNAPPAEHFEPLVRADMRSVPLPRGGYDAVSAVNCLYFIADPREAIREAYALLRPGGLFLASAPSRYHDPEVKHLIPDWGERSSFDAEEAAAIVGDVFGDVRSEWWELAAYILPTAEAVADYFVMFRYPNPDHAAMHVELPLTITKSGVNVWARKSR